MHTKFVSDQSYKEAIHRAVYNLPDGCNDCLFVKSGKNYICEVNSARPDPFEVTDSNCTLRYYRCEKSEDTGISDPSSDLKWSVVIMGNIFRPKSMGVSRVSGGKSVFSSTNWTMHELLRHRGHRRRRSSRLKDTESKHRQRVQWHFVYFCRHLPAVELYTL